MSDDLVSGRPHDNGAIPTPPAEEGVTRPAAEVDRALRFTLQHADQHSGEAYQAFLEWGSKTYDAICEQVGPRGGPFDEDDECSVRFGRMRRSFDRLWRAFLLVCLLNVMLIAVALWGWLR